MHPMLVLPSLRYSLATHHAGHIVAAHIADPTRIRRTRLTAGCNHHNSIVPTVTESALRAEMMVALGGVVAEEIFAGESGAYAANDLARATEIAAKMVGSFGMAGSVVSLRSASGKQRDFIARVLDDPRARKDVEAVLAGAKQEAVRALLGKRQTIIALRDALLRQGRLSPEQIRSLVAGADRRRHDDDKVLVDLRVVGGGKSAAQAGR
jgi:ATP-dependent Zn protease